MSTNQSMIDFIKGSVKDTKQEKLVLFNKSLTAEHFFEDVEKVGAFLKSKGVKKGDSVAILLPNIFQGVISVYAINSIGAIANVVHPKIGAEKLLEIAKETNTKWVFLYDKFFTKHKDNAEKNGVNLIVCRLTDYDKSPKFYLNNSYVGKHDNVVFYKDILAANLKIDKQENIEGDEPAVYLHSSGTTGKPKTVVLSNKAMNELAYNIYKTVDGKIGLHEGESMLMTLPLFHGFGLGVCVHLMMYFGKIILIPSFKAKSTVRALRKYEVNFMCVVPNMMKRIMKEKNFSGKWLKPVRQIYVGGDKADEKVMKEYKRIFSENGSDCIISEGFGLSETASVTHINMDCKEGGTVGRPINGVETRIMGDDGEKKPGESGLIYISSPSVMNGYLGEENNNLVKDENGKIWLNTGDIGYVDEEGYLYYKGRQKRMHKIGGVNIFPQEVETVAESLPEIKKACAIRVSWKGKQALKLLVVLDKGNLDGKLKTKIEEAIATHILPYAVPKSIESVKELRINALGKTDYKYYENKEAEK